MEKQIRTKTLKSDQLIWCIPNWCVAIALTIAPCLSPAHTGLAEIDAVGNYDNSVGSSDSASQGVINSQIIENRPLLRPGEMLEYVPGMVATQHSGDGKAISLRTHLSKNSHRISPT